MDVLEFENPVAGDPPPPPYAEVPLAETGFRNPSQPYYLMPVFPQPLRTEKKGELPTVAQSTVTRSVIDELTGATPIFTQPTGSGFYPGEMERTTVKQPYPEDECMEECCFWAQCCDITMKTCLICCYGIACVCEVFRHC